MKRVQFCPVGIYTIVTVSEDVAASMWGKLKSGIGWRAWTSAGQYKLNNESLPRLRALGEILMFAGFFLFADILLFPVFRWG